MTDAELSAYLRDRDAFDARVREEAWTRPLPARPRKPHAPLAADVPPAFATWSAARTAWESKMLVSGRIQAAENARLRALGPRSGANPEGWDANTFGRTYYDAMRCFYHVADYTGDPAWNAAVDDAMFFWRDTYVLPQGGAVTGFWHFAHGLAEHFRRTGDPASREAAVLMSRRAAYSADHDAPQTVAADLSREAAYALMSHLVAESLGEPRRDVTARLIEIVFGHFDQWFGPSSRRPQPFMVALSCEALIQLDASTPGGDPRVIPTVVRACDAIWDQHWRPDGSFNYIYVDKPDEPSHDLNLLICPIYGWAYAQTGDVRHRDRGDLAFGYGILGAWTDHPSAAKQYDQCYRWSTDYVLWRGTSYVVEVPPGQKPKKIRIEVPHGKKPRAYLLPEADDGETLDAHSS